jgi:hypothetical protein
LMKDGLTADGVAYERDTPQRVMLTLIDFWIPRLTRMDALLAYTEPDSPLLLTSDNPAVMWKKNSGWFYMRRCRSIRPAPRYLLPPRPQFAVRYLSDATIS